MDLGTSSPFSGHVNLAFTSPSVPSPVQRVDDEHGSGVTAMGLVSQPPDSAHGSMKEFFGDSSAISFIKQLQDTLRPNAPTGTESNRERRQHRVHGRTSSPRPISSEPWVNSLPPRTLADHLVDCYFAKIHTLYPFVHKYAFLAMYRSLWTAQGFPSGRKPTNGLGLGDTGVNSITFYYALNAIFALGCQFSTVVQAERETTSEAFFRLCKPALDLDSLQGSDLALVQTLLLMVHYLQGSRTPDRCWHVIGTACRVAQAIGLHADSGNSNRSFAEIQIRRRVWHGCVMLDLSVSTILGRPPMISLKPVTPPPEAIDDCYLNVSNEICVQPPNMPSRVAWFVETLKLYEMLRKLLTTLYDNTGSNREDTADKKAESLFQSQSILAIDSELQEFKRALPTNLNWEARRSEEQPAAFLRERYLLRARFTHMKVLLYRPVLSQTLHDARGMGENERDLIEHSGINSKFVLDCAVFGVQAAVDLASLVHETCSTELSSVWFYSAFYAFTAGSVILLAELSPAIVNIVTRSALEKAWDQCQESLNYLSSYSDTAGRCAQTLSMIRSKCLTITDQQEQDDQSPDSGEPANLGQNEASRHPDLAPEASYMPFTDDLFRAFDFNDDTLFDPFWFNLKF